KFRSSGVSLFPNEKERSNNHPFSLEKKRIIPKEFCNSSKFRSSGVSLFPNEKERSNNHPFSLEK
ncbi:MAG: hypothetical protein IJW64_00005, partial [Clostridia bacterium]|nr:hypothetical protein [Clostridia bacterium]